ncbi:sarcosine oxidase subunit alpha family protein [Ostreibacterium oceani]|uniref:Sarcosine oxidase subunit alpha family protein n=1 Tax=Ostreibacterium oceani TaxID=2654998 RepID=A0A6N7EUD3_9GAMM|nr:sarcosine oxidase subunit alpha family protein [Ostreibacterium oceani]MPV86042.1 sarcosine oxidase subunit alpha family protein [Ostreibacterium oceani]
MRPCVKRLPVGGQINRDKPLHFTFNGKAYIGYEGDTLASALLANGVKILGRSFKYHRPRSIFGLGAEEPNVLLQIGEGAKTLPNQRATQVMLYDGLVAKTVNGFPCVNYDFYAGLGLFSKMLSAGFYYKTFMWPKSAWDWYEEKIRAAAGLGISPVEADPDIYEHRNQHVDILIVGGGVAGIRAALAAAASGQRIMLVDEQSTFGGWFQHSQQKIDGIQPKQWIAQAIQTLRNQSNVTVLNQATAFGRYDHNFIAVLEKHGEVNRAAHQPRETVWHIRAKHLILATGAQERGLSFGNNDRPGIMLASAVSGYIHRYGVKLGSNGVLFTNNDGAYQAAIDMQKAGITVKAVIDVRHQGAGSIAQAVKALGIKVYNGYTVVNTYGRKGIHKIRVTKLTEDKRALTDVVEDIACDVLAVSGGYSPVIHLHSHIGGKNRWNEEKLCFVPDPATGEGIYFAGAITGELSTRGCLRQGAEIGYQVSKGVNGATGETASEITVPCIQEHQENPIEAYWQTPYAKGPTRAPKQFVDYQNDTGVSDIYQAITEGYKSIEHIKRYTALGFGTDQGKTGNINGMAVAAEKMGKTIPEVGTTTFRPAYTPVTFGALAGREIGEFFNPIRTTAMHEWHVSHGAEFELVGDWYRPWYYPQDGEDMEAAVARECLATRHSVGMLDASTLGKIEVKGKDAAKFLNMMYTNPFLKLGIGKARYGLMLGEDGMLMDDGVVLRLAEDHFYVHTTTGGAASVFNWMERWAQTEWPEMEVFFTSVTDHFATTAVVGPNSRNVLESLCDDIDFSNEAFEFMSFREGTIDGIPVRVCRISFSGELAFEVNVNANYGRHIWEAIYAAGQPFNITPYGTETMHVLRAEKGYIIVGQDTDGSVSPHDLGMAWAIGKNKAFIGDRSLHREDMVRDNRKQLIGLETADPKQVLPEGAQLINTREYEIPADMQGHVTSSYYSHSLNKSIALALVKGGLSRIGETLYSPRPEGGIVEAKIVSPVFYDEAGEKRDG